MDNFTRGDRALEALKGYRLHHRLDGSAMSDKQIVTGSDDEDSTFGGYPLSDLLADMMHLAQRYNVDIHGVIWNGAAQFGADVIEQAWEHGDDWEPTLQDPANIPHAIEVLEITGVPEFAHVEAMRLVGFPTEGA